MISWTEKNMYQEEKQKDYILSEVASEVTVLLNACSKLFVIWGWKTQSYDKWTPEIGRYLAFKGLQRFLDQETMSRPEYEP